MVSTAEMQDDMPGYKMCASWSPGSKAAYSVTLSVPWKSKLTPQIGNTCLGVIALLLEPPHEISNNVVYATSKASDQPAQTRSLIRAFASRLNIAMSFKLLTEYHFEFLRITEGCTDSSESTLVKMPHCWKSHDMVHFLSWVSFFFCIRFFFFALYW